MSQERLLDVEPVQRVAGGRWRPVGISAMAAQVLTVLEAEDALYPCDGWMREVDIGEDTSLTGAGVEQGLQELRQWGYRIEEETKQISGTWYRLFRSNWRA